LGFHGSVLYLSFVLLFLSIFGFMWSRKNEQRFLSGKFWLLVSAVFFFLTVGPFAYLGTYAFKYSGMAFTIPLPYFLFYLLPIVKGILVPPRFEIFLFFPLIVLAAFAMKEVLKKIVSPTIRTALLFLIAGVFIFENFTFPLKSVKADIPNYYHQLGAETGNYALLELPFALSTSFYTLGSVPASSKIQYYQSVHHKKILGGWISRVPDEYYDFYSKITGLDYLINPQKAKTNEEIGKLKTQTKENFKKLEIKHIILHPEYYTHKQLRNSINFLNEVYNQKPVLRDGMLVYDLIN